MNSPIYSASESCSSSSSPQSPNNPQLKSLLEISSPNKVSHPKPDFIINPPSDSIVHWNGEEYDNDLIFHFYRMELVRTNRDQYFQEIVDNNLNYGYCCFDNSGAIQFLPNNRLLLKNTSSNEIPIECCGIWVNNNNNNNNNNNLSLISLYCTEYVYNPHIQRFYSSVGAFCCIFINNSNIELYEVQLDESKKNNFTAQYRAIKFPKFNSNPNSIANTPRQEIPQFQLDSPHTTHQEIPIASHTTNPISSVLSNTSAHVPSSASSTRNNTHIISHHLSTLKAKLKTSKLSKQEQQSNNIKQSLPPKQYLYSFDDSSSSISSSSSDDDDSFLECKDISSYLMKFPR